MAVPPGWLSMGSPARLRPLLEVQKRAPGLGTELRVGVHNKTNAPHADSRARAHQELFGVVALKNRKATGLRTGGVVAAAPAVGWKHPASLGASGV